MTMKIILPGAALAPLLSLASHAATVAIPEGTYTQNFNSMAAAGSTEPAAGWSLRTGATAASLGSGVLQPLGPVRAWTHSTGQFKNVSSSNIASTSDSTAQAANTDRALALRQLSGFGNPGASFNFNFSSTGVQLSSITLDLLMLDATSGSNTFVIQYGLGESPASFVTLGSWADPGVFGATGFSFDRDDFGSSLDNQSQVFFRVVSLDPGTGSAFDMIAIDNFSTIATSVPEPSAMLLGTLGALGILRRRR